MQALEDNRFDVLGAPVFAKGHLRKYAELVGVSVEDVLSDYYRLNRSAGAPPLVGLRRHPSGERHIVRWLAIALVIIVAAGAAYWWFTRQPPLGSSPRTPVTEPAPAVAEPAPPVREDGPAAETPAADDTDTPAADEAEPGTPGEPAAGEQVADDQIAEEPVAEEPAPARIESPAPAEPEPAQTAAEGQVELRLTYSGDCWTEVTDATGRRLFFDLGRDGRVVTVSGVAPLQVLLGVADNVSVAVDGVDYVIRNSEMRGNNTARLTIRGR